MKIRRSIVGQTNVCCNRYSDGTIFVGALTDFMHRSVKSRVAKSPRTQTHPTATVEAVRASCSWSVIRMNGSRRWPSRPGRMKHSSWSTLFCGLRGSTTSSRRCCRRLVLGGSCGARSLLRRCRPSWPTCATWRDQRDARWLVSVEPDLGCRAVPRMLSLYVLISRPAWVVSSISNTA